MTADMTIITAPPLAKCPVPIEWVQTHNPQDALLLARLLRQASPSVRKAIGARLACVETTDEITALMAIIRCLGKLQMRATRRQLLEMIAAPAIPLEQVETAAALYYARQEAQRLCQAAPPEMPRSSQPLSLGDATAGLDWYERALRKHWVRNAQVKLESLIGRMLKVLSFLVGWLGGSLSGVAFCGGLAALAFVLLRPVYISDWKAFILDTSTAHYIGWGALSLCAFLLPVALVMFPLHAAVALFNPVRRFYEVRRLLRMMEQMQWNDNAPAALMMRARAQVREWHSAPLAAVMRVSSIGLAVAGGLVCIAGVMVIGAKLFAAQLISGDLFWPLMVGVVALSYLVYAIVRLYALVTESVDDLV